MPGHHFEIYVVIASEVHQAFPQSIAGPKELTIRKFNITAVAQTRHHRMQRYNLSATTQNTDLLDAKNWEIGYFDGDGWDDMRYVVNLSEKGCRRWRAERWQPDRERFSAAPQLSKSVDARGKVVANCPR